MTISKRPQAQQPGGAPASAAASVGGGGPMVNDSVSHQEPPVSPPRADESANEPLSAYRQQLLAEIFQAAYLEDECEQTPPESAAHSDDITDLNGEKP